MCTTFESVTPDIWMSDVESNSKMIESCMDKIPEIGVVPSHCLKSGRLVRFRGMIQDMSDPVLYLHKYEIVNNVTGLRVIRCGKYKDVLDVEENEDLDEESPNLEHSERRSLYCVSVPGLNNWVRVTPHVSDNVHQIQNHHMEINSSTSGQSKRTVEEMEQDIETTSDNAEFSKRHQSEPKQEEAHVDILLNHPIKSKNNYSCLINVYEDLDEKLFKMNSVVDVVGFVSFKSDCDDFTHLPATLVPRIHAVSVKIITHSNPFQSSFLDQNSVLSKAEKVRAELMLILTRLFLGDSQTAEYVLCNLISRIYHRDELLTLGHFSVNITNVPMDCNYPEEVYNVLKSLIPKSHYIPMTLENMNTDKFLPEKDYENNRLKSGTLQLSDHTHLFVDETKMVAGQLNANGVSNLKALNELVTEQTSDYDFKYVKVGFQVDVPTIVMSEGKSMLSTSVQVILNREANSSFIDAIESVKESLKEPFLTEVRQYLSVISHADFILAENVIETIQQDYVKLRQEEKRVNESDLHLLLILSRLISLSYGQVKLTKEMWEKAFEMELFRKERINNREP